MKYVVNEALWDSIIKDPLWYNDPRMKDMILTRFVNPPARKQRQSWYDNRKAILSYFTERLGDGMVSLGDWPEFKNDDDRFKPEHGFVTPIDTIVVHHTATDPGISFPELNALGMLRLYAPEFMKKSFNPDGPFEPISSGHFYKDVQTFVGYHYVIRRQGKVEMLLDPRYTGFHAGKYSLNVRSIGIAFVGNYTDTLPDLPSLNAARELIRQWARSGTDRVVGHGEVREGTECPGKLWKLWKPLLMD